MMVTSDMTRTYNNDVIANATIRNKDVIMIVCVSRCVRARVCGCVCVCLGEEGVAPLRVAKSHLSISTRLERPVCHE